jgi:hypothetical protein
VADNLFFWVADRYKVYTRSFYYAAEVFAFLAAVEAGLLSPQVQYLEEVERVREHPVFASARDRTELEWGALVREIYGPTPFRITPFEPRWRTPAVLGISHRIYDERDFAGMPILADALADAGCDDEAILDHLRGPGPHVRGCWALDRVLAKE